MAIQNIYKDSTEQVIASYNYTDIAEGTGVVAFQGFNSNISGASTYHLGTETIYSADIESLGAADPSTFTFLTKPFNLPKTIRGTAIIRFAAACVTGSGSLFPKVTLQLISGSDTITLSEIYGTNTTGTATKGFVLPIDIAQQHIKRGDYLKIILVLYGNGDKYFGHDPKARAGTNIGANYGTPFEAYIPFKIDL